ncbi:ABC transporter permease, partial [Arthrospira platensis SPKY1]|nr:ABC transporter permease [Arthrospira platensis SPKY1]
MLLFGLFVAMAGYNAIEVWSLLFLGAFGDSFSIQNTLLRAAPLMLTALCVALPARAGLTVIGGEGALILGALACASLPYLWVPPQGYIGSVILLTAAALAGSGWIALAGWLRQYRGVNETISSLLLAYVAVNVFKHLVEGPL